MRGPMKMIMHSAPILVEVTRGAIMESRHRGHIAIVDYRGALVASVGDPHYYSFARSSAKLLQAIPLLETGGAEAFGLTDEEIALICASHNGEPVHTETALQI